MTMWRSHCTIFKINRIYLDLRRELLFLGSKLLTCNASELKLKGIFKTWTLPKGKVAFVHWFFSGGNEIKWFERWKSIHWFYQNLQSVIKFSPLPTIIKRRTNLLKLILSKTFLPSADFINQWFSSFKSIYFISSRKN